MTHLSTRPALLLLALRLLLGLLPSPLAAAEHGLTTPPAGGWPEHPATGGRMVPLTEAGRDRARFLIGVPKEYNRDQEWPLWIVLHGGPAGGRPDEMASFFRGGLMARGAICAFPQSLEDRLLEWNYPDEGMYLLRIILRVAQEYRIDPRRIYLAGHSMGGGGTWCMGAVLGDVWAGLGPMSGWYAATPLPDPTWLKGLPVWCVHGEADPVVPAQMSRMALDALKKQGHRIQSLDQPPTRDLVPTLTKVDAVFRFMPGVGHDVFAPFPKRGAVEVGALVAWLSAHQRQKPADLDAAGRRLATWGKGFGWKPEGGFLGTGADDPAPVPKR